MVEYPASQVSLCVLAHMKTVQKEIANNPQPTDTQDPWNNEQDIRRYSFKPIFEETCPSCQNNHTKVSSFTDIFILPIAYWK
jgi:hypothetical protein